MQNKLKLALLIIIILLTLGLIYFFCNNFNKIAEKIRVNDFLNTETDKSTELVKKEEGKLILKLDNGTEKVILDIIGEGDVFSIIDNSKNQSEDTRIHTFDKLHEDINCYGIIVRYYIGMDYSNYYLLVNKKNGEEFTMTSTNIVISPNKKRILSYNYDLISGFTANGFDIVKFNGDNFILEYRLETIDWGPADAKWINDSELEFKRMIINDNYDEEISGVVKFKFIDDEWVKFEERYPDYLSNDQLEALDKMGVTNNFKYEDALLPDGTKIRE